MKSSSSTNSAFHITNSSIPSHFICHSDYYLEKNIGVKNGKDVELIQSNISDQSLLFFLNDISDDMVLILI